MLTLEQIRAAVAEVAPKYGIEKVYLFGSYARSDADEESDCDFRVEGSKIDSLYDICEIFDELSEKLGRKADIVLKKNIKPEIYDNMREDEVLIYGGV